jgi:uncharacterized repeat protein (TIGR04076 family)
MVVVKIARSRVKITVLKRVDPSVIFDGEVPNLPGTDEKYGICTFYEDGQEFIVESDGSMPGGFCKWAWRDISRSLSVIQWGGNYSPALPDGVAIACCNDGIRPVSFKLERVED